MSAADTALTTARRDRELRDLADGDGLDLLVIGGGVTGAGIALDAAARGLTVALVEAHDLAHGTSRWSSKLAHGGLRYLASGQVGIAYRSAVERHLLLTRTAPHLARPLGQVVPLLPGMPRTSRALVRTGFALGDGLRRAAGTPPRVLPPPRRISPGMTGALVPGVLRDGLDGAYLNYDGQLIDDARLVVALARTAAGLGARVLTRVRADQVTDTSARLTDRVTGQSGEVRARAVIAAAGVWADRIDPSIRLRPSRGTHLVLDAAALGRPAGALTVPIPGTVNRFVFALPAQHDRIYLGLTDEEAPGEVPDVPEPTEAEIDFLLDTANTALSRALTRADVCGAFAGLRPLIDSGDTGGTADLSREHALLTPDGGPISIVGGKLTEYRLMAEQAVDAALARHRIAAGPRRTRDLPLVGAPGHPASPAGPADPAIPPALRARFGAESAAVVATGRAAGLADPLAPIVEGLDVTGAEVVFAARYEGAAGVDDVLDRRTRIGLVAADRERAAGPVAALLEALGGEAAHTR